MRLRDSRCHLRASLQKEKKKAAVVDRRWSDLVDDRPSSLRQNRPDSPRASVRADPKPRLRHEPHANRRLREHRPSNTNPNRTLREPNRPPRAKPGFDLVSYEAGPPPQV
ncbi:hypothetical protein RJT34_09907 [Clitoria ternatea]|uniref:Uncharacterized protein n=1 Tax=Clitoria ternatea TaxID=43366 RepID=A0AAN9K7F9_CLITE